MPLAQTYKQFKDDQLIPEWVEAYRPTRHIIVRYKDFFTDFTVSAQSSVGDTVIYLNMKEITDVQDNAIKTPIANIYDKYRN